MSQNGAPAETVAFAHRNGAIDTLRGIAVMLVVLTHISVSWASFPLGDIGRTGVLLFFIISGYCIFLAVNKYRQDQLKYFLVKRFFRLYPVYWGSILGVVMVSSEKHDVTAVLYNLTMVQRIFSVTDINGVSWTLLIEIIFYVIIAILIVFGLVNRREIVLRLFYGFIIFTLFTAVVRYVTLWDMPFAHALFITTFLFGGVMYFNEQTRQPLANTLIHALAFLAGVLAISWLVYNDPNTGVGEIDAYDTLSYFGNYMIATLLFLIGTLFLRIETRITSYLGFISYCLYLFHGIVLKAIEPFIQPSSVGSTGLVLVLLILASALVHHVVEKPFIAVGGNLLKRWNARKSVSVSAKI